MTGTEKPAHILFQTTEIGGSVKHSMGISNPFRNDTVNETYRTIWPTIFHLKKKTRPKHSDQNYSLQKSLDSGTDVPISGKNIDNRTGMNPQGLIVAKIPDSNRANNCNIFDFNIGTLDLDYRESFWHGAKKSESEKAWRQQNFRKFWV